MSETYVDEDTVTLNVSEEMPDEWKRIGFSGMFAVVAELPIGTDLDVVAAKCPQFVGGDGDRSMALRVVRGLSTPRVIHVYKDAVGFMASVTR